MTSRAYCVKKGVLDVDWQGASEGGVQRRAWVDLRGRLGAVSVGQNWHLDCNKSLHSAPELVPGRSIDTVSFCGWAFPRTGCPLRIHILQKKTLEHLQPLERPSLAKLLFVEFCGLVFGTAAVFLCRSGIRICFEILLGF